MSAPSPSLLGDPHAVPDSAFPADGPMADRLRFLVHYAVLAPSVLNTQPWRFEIDGARLLLLADRSRQLRRVDPEGRELTVSCGAALFHLHVAARHFGHSLLPAPDAAAADPDVLACVRLHTSGPPSAQEERLFRAIPMRRTNRDAFAEGEASADLLAAMAAAARVEDVWLTAIEEPAAKAALADLVEEAVRQQNRDPATVAELSGWLRERTDPRRDGVSDGVQGAMDRLARVPVSATRLAAGKRALVEDAPAVLVLSTDTDAPAAWLAAGRALARILLLGASHGLMASYFNQPVEVAPVREALAAGVGGGHPQVVFRIGYPVERPGTPRRHVQDVLARGAAPPA